MYIANFMRRAALLPRASCRWRSRPYTTRPLGGATRLVKEDIEITPSGLKVRIADGRRRSILPNLWLRDNCRCPECVNKDTQQRQVKTFEIPRDIHPVQTSLQLNKDIQTFNVDWSDGHRSSYDTNFLRTYLEHGAPARDSSCSPPATFWGAGGPKNIPALPYQDVGVGDGAIGKLTDLIRTYGFVFVDGVPFSDASFTCQLLNRIGPIRETHYGGFYDFTADLAKADTAYTNLALPPHTDTTYFSEPAGLQAFHLLEHERSPGDTSKQPLGGLTLLIDGFHAADVLRRTNPEAAHILSVYRLPWHASGNKGISITPDELYPVFEHSREQDDLIRVRWNNDDRGVVPFMKDFNPDQWYEAARAWNEILEDQSMKFWVKLQPGRLLIFDNWRVLHGRSAFTGNRRMCGGYINRDDFMSRWRTLNLSPEEVKRRVIG